MVAAKRCNPLESITVESLTAKRKSPTMSAHHWARFVLNVPARSGIAAIAESEWHDAATAEESPAGAEVWLGIDFGWQRDTTAIVPLWWKSSEERILGPATILEPPGGNEQLDVRLVRHAIQEACRQYTVQRIVMDSSRAEDVAAWLADELNLLVEYRAQTAKPKGEDYERFMSALRNGWLRHSGDDGLRRHALNAVTKLLADGGAMFARPSDSRTGNQSVKVIDALVAASMVHSVRAGDTGSYLWTFDDVEVAAA
jgi:phage terminase large subunit-like protein